MRRKFDFKKVDITLSPIKRINIIITTNEYQEQPPKINEKFPRRHLWGRSVISKKLISHFHMNVFPRVVSTLSQQLLLKLQQKNLHRQKFTEWKTSVLIPQYLLSRMLSIIFRFSCFFSKFRDHILMCCRI